VNFTAEYEDFCRAWLAGGDRNSRYQCFDTYFKLWVVYNRLYGQVAFALANRGDLNLAARESFPDAEAAQDYVVQYVGAGNLIQAIEKDVAASDALATLIRLIDSHEFYIRLHRVTGKRQPECDRQLLAELTSNSRDERARAVLETLYSIRCNMVHGHKAYREVQCRLLDPAAVVLRKVADIVLAKLREDC
jgi:hypothetical protein